MDRAITRLSQSARPTPTIRAGLNGNYYAYCTKPEPLQELCRRIGKSPGAVYWNRRHRCYAVRMRLKDHQVAIKEIKLSNTL